MQPLSVSKFDFSILVGNALDHLDTALYGFLAPLIAPLFFPDHIPVVQLILAYSVLCTSLITRPIGVLLFGKIAQSKGPGISLLYSLMGVSMCTLLMGCLPAYDTLGSLACVGLIMLRMLSGVFGAGESSIARLYITQGKVGQAAIRASYRYEFSTMAGIIGASAISSYVLSLDSAIFAWRWAFIVCGCLSGLMVALRKQFKGSLEPIMLHSSVSIFRMLWRYKGIVILIGLTSALSYVTYAVPFIVMNGLVPLIGPHSLETMMQYNTPLLVIDMVLIMLAGRCVQNTCPRKTMGVSSGLLAVSLPVLFGCIQDASIAYIVCVRFWIVLLGVIFMCPANFYYRQLLGSGGHTYLVCVIASTLGASTLGRWTPALCVWIWHSTQSMVWVGAYLGAIAMSAAVSIYLMQLRTTDVAR